ncbi:unnamed protein product [Ambrosiozyma monospora]|uniref:Unnamed protein product n=1 Tax=Ambrosiozyma monospora TaxID=43982 RepID=A0ACB5T991_AMBMO|nr:unnamed protein product [Ambrosiozyma monospora]
MNSIQGYSSDSDSDSDLDQNNTLPSDKSIPEKTKAQPKPLPKPSLASFNNKTPQPTSHNNKQVRPPSSSNKVLGASIKNTFNDESVIKSTIVLPESKIKPTDLIPSHLLLNKPTHKKQSPKSLPSSTEYKNSDLEINKLQDILGIDVFGISNDTSKKRDFEKSEISSSSDVPTFDALGGLSEITEKARTNSDDILLEPEQKRRRKGREIDESKITEIRMDEFYQENNKMIEKGELDAKEHIFKNSKIRYYQQGNNNLSDVIRFAESNKDKLSWRFEKEQGKAKEKKHSFK